MKNKIFKKLQKRIVKSFIDILILAKLKDGEPMSGYDVIAFIHRKFHILMSPGTIYAVLYALEREELIEGMWKSRKRAYKLLDKGEKTINDFLNSYKEIQSFMATLFVNSPLSKLL
jgi:DNA-binding PadR family transcriptional regulator